MNEFRLNPELPRYTWRSFWRVAGLLYVSLAFIVCPALHLIYGVQTDSRGGPSTCCWAWPGKAAASGRSFGVDLVKVREQVAALVRQGVEEVRARNLPLTDRSKRVVAVAKTESRRLKHRYLGQEHLLLGLVADPNALSKYILTNLGVQPDRLRHEIVTLLGQPDAV